MTSGTRRRLHVLWIVACLVAAHGALAPQAQQALTRSLHAGRGKDMTSAYVQGFAQMKPLLGDTRRLACWTDPPIDTLWGGKNMLVSGNFCLAQYALAPIVLEPATEQDELVLLIASDRATWTAEARRRGAALVMAVGEHAALVARPKP